MPNKATEYRKADLNDKKKLAELFLKIRERASQDLIFMELLAARLTELHKCG